MFISYKAFSIRSVIARCLISHFTVNGEIAKSVRHAKTGKRGFVVCIDTDKNGKKQVNKIGGVEIYEIHGEVKAVFHSTPKIISNIANHIARKIKRKFEFIRFSAKV